MKVLIVAGLVLYAFAFSSITTGIECRACVDGSSYACGSSGLGTPTKASTCCSAQEVAANTCPYSDCVHKSGKTFTLAPYRYCTFNDYPESWCGDTVVINEGKTNVSGVSGGVYSQDVCVYNIQLANATHKMRFNITKGSTNDYLASVFLVDPSDSNFTPVETSLYVG